MSKFIMVDGLDGSGKGVVVDALKEWSLKKGLKVIDLREWWKSSQGYPDISLYDVVISAEPTFTGWGKKIREHLIKNGTTSSSFDIAEAYSKDRKELYEKVIIPAKKAGKYIFQERGVVTSLVYQPTMPGLNLELVMNLEGNRFCLEHPPDILVITVVEPEVVMERLKIREKKDEAIFERLEFQKKVKNIYTSRWLKRTFEEKGTKVIYLDTNPPSTVEDTKNKAVKVIEENK